MIKKRKKRIIISCLVLNSSRSGYRTIIKNLVENSFYNNLKNENIFIFQKSGWDSLELDFKNKTCEKSTKLIVLKTFKSKWIRAICEQILIPFFAIFYRCDFIFMPCTFGLVFPLKKVITFVHTNTSFSVPFDLRGRGYLQQLAHNMMTKITALTSSKLLFTTNATKSEYIKFNNLSSSANTVVIGNGIKTTRNTVENSSKMDFIGSAKFFLSVSQIYRLKNFDSLIKAYLRFQNHSVLEENVKLVIVGTIQERDYFKELKILCRNNKNIIFLHNISDSELNWLYKKCETYVFLSYFEGYSLTPAEAICAGKKVILSDIEVHREVYKDLAYFVNPYSVDSIYKGLINRNKHDISEKTRNKFIDRISHDKFIKRLSKEIISA